MPDTLEVPKPPPLPPDPWKIEESEKQPIEILPQEVKGAINNLIKTIIAQETSPQGEVRMSPDRIDYYKKRLSEVQESQYLNPHVTPQKKIMS